MEHIEKTHSPEVLVLFGIEYIKQYEVKFDTNSEEQINLRFGFISIVILPYVSYLLGMSLFVESSVELARTPTTLLIG